MIFECKICNKMDSQCAWPQKLVGGYVAILCAEHLNEWTEHIRDNPLYNKLRNIEARDDNEARRDIPMILDDLYYVGKNWVKDQIAKHENTTSGGNKA